MRIFLSGGRGMVGRNFSENAKARDHEVVAPSRAELDLSDRSAVTAFLTDGLFDIVVHCAGRVGGIQDNMRHPVDFLVDNFEIGRNVVIGARDARIARLLNLSSSCIYPRDHSNPLEEEMILSGPLELTNEGYALAKIAVLRLCDYVSREDGGFRYKTAIPCNIYGRYDKFDAVRAHLVPAAIAKVDRAARSGSSQLDIWGDGLSRREFMYAEDLADFMWAAVERFEDLPDLINVGLGEDHSIDEYYQAVAAVVGWSGVFRHDLDKPSGMRRKLVNTRRQDAFGWQPRFTLEQGIKRTYDFYLQSSSLASLRGNRK